MIRIPLAALFLLGTAQPIAPGIELLPSSLTSSISTSSGAPVVLAGWRTVTAGDPAWWSPSTPACISPTLAGEFRVSVAVQFSMQAHDPQRGTRALSLYRTSPGSEPVLLASCAGAPMPDCVTHQTLVVDGSGASCTVRGCSDESVSAEVTFESGAHAVEGDCFFAAAYQNSTESVWLAHELYRAELVRRSGPVPLTARKEKTE